MVLWAHTRAFGMLSWPIARRLHSALPTSSFGGTGSSASLRTPHLRSARCWRRLLTRFALHRCSQRRRAPWSTPTAAWRQRPARCSSTRIRLPTGCADLLLRRARHRAPLTDCFSCAPPSPSRNCRRADDPGPLLSSSAVLGGSRGPTTERERQIRKCAFDGAPRHRTEQIAGPRPEQRLDGADRVDEARRRDDRCVGSSSISEVEAELEQVETVLGEEVDRDEDAGIELQHVVSPGAGVAAQVHVRDAVVGRARRELLGDLEHGAVEEPTERTREGRSRRIGLPDLPRDDVAVVGEKAEVDVGAVDVGLNDLRSPRPVAKHSFELGIAAEAAETETAAAFSRLDYDGVVETVLGRGSRIAHEPGWDHG